MHTMSTPIRSTATTRSGSVGPFSSLMNVRHAAAASMVNATTDGVISAPNGRHSAENAEYAAFEPRLDFAPRRIRRGHVHDVDVEELAIGRHVERDAAGRRVDQHRQQKN